VLVAGLLVLSALSIAACGLPTSSRPAAAGSAKAILFATLDDVTCQTAGHCIAVGDFLPVDQDADGGDPDGDGQSTRTLVESSAGRHWRLLPSPDEGHGGARLSSVSCPVPDDCMAVGFYRPAPFPLQAKIAPPSYPLIEAYDGHVWRIVPSPSVAPNSVLVSISCPSISVCTAVGSTTTSVGQNPVESSFVETFDGQSWDVVPLSPPAGTSSGLNSVSCPNISTCVAVGDIAPISDVTDTRPLIEMLAGGTWTMASLPSGDADAGILYNALCLSVGNCLAVGSAASAHTSGSALVLSLRGSTWTADPTALSQAGDVSLTTLGCSSSTDCLVAGTSLVSYQKVVARIDGSRWHELSVPSKSDNIQAIACQSLSQCLIVGSTYVNDFGNTTTLIASVSGGTWTAERGAVP
jgi:hypothetical protein